MSCSIDDDSTSSFLRNAWHLSRGEGWCANSSGESPRDGGRFAIGRGVEDDLGLQMPRDAPRFCDDSGAGHRCVAVDSGAGDRHEEPSARAQSRHTGLRGGDGRGARGSF